MILQMNVQRKHVLERLFLAIVICKAQLLLLCETGGSGETKVLHDCISLCIGTILMRIYTSTY